MSRPINTDPGIVNVLHPVQNDTGLTKNSSSNTYILGGRNLRHEFKGGREISVGGHFSEEDSFPAKGPRNKTVNHDTKMLVETDSGNFRYMEEHVPNTVQNLNIRPRQQVRGDAIVGSIEPREVEDFTDLQETGEKSSCLGKSGVQEESIFNNNESQIVVNGTPFVVSTVLEASDRYKAGTYGVLLDYSLRASRSGRYNIGTEFSVLKILGKGGFGEVDLCQHKSGKKYVTKRIFNKFHKKEVQVLMSLSHPNITGFFGYIWRDGTHEILMEFGGISLKTFVEMAKKNGAALSVQFVMKLALQGFSALQYMHAFGILHLDIKPENICISHDAESIPVIKLTDFGTSKTPEQAISHEGWTPEYMSPEACKSVMVSQRPELARLFQGYDLTGKADVFAFSLTIYFMLEASHAVIDIWRKEINPDTFSEMRPRFIFSLAQVPNYIRDAVVQRKRPAMVDKLFADTLAGDSDQRLTAEEAGHFIKEEILKEEVCIPNILPPDSPASPSVEMQDDLMSSQMTVDMDFSLRKSRLPGGGKDIKNHLRQKILRRKSSGPYQRLESVKSTGKVEMPKVDHDPVLPMFSALLDD